MLWLIITIIAYLILAVVLLVDKYLLGSSIPNHKLYAFYIGLLGLGTIAIIPFVGPVQSTDFYLPGAKEAFLAFVSGSAFVCGMLWFLKGLKMFEASRMVPAVGAILPIFTYFLILIFSAGDENLNLFDYSAFILLILGSFLITFEKKRKISFKSLKFSMICAFFIALSFVSAKYVYMEHPFLVGFIWIRVSGALFALTFLLDSVLRKELLGQKVGSKKKTAFIFLLNQGAGAVGNILQQWAIALAPLVFIAFINALQGVQYIFLFLFTILLSLKFPYFLKEEINKKVILQKIAAIILIGSGLALLAF